MTIASVSAEALAEVALPIVAAASLALARRTARIAGERCTQRKTLPLETTDQPVTLVQCAWRALARPAAAFSRAPAIYVTHV
jgi:hypothetical protein